MIIMDTYMLISKFLYPQTIATPTAWSALTEIIPGSRNQQECPLLVQDQSVTFL